MVGQEVRIRIWDDNPPFWDDAGFMLSLARTGDTFIVEEQTEEGYYALQNVRGYIWRSIDLIPVNDKDPNYLFKMKNMPQ